MNTFQFKKNSTLRQLGHKNSSKVFQVLREKRQIHAIKYVEEADEQTDELWESNSLFE